MDSDDDYQSFSPLKEPSPEVQYRRLKRLKKSDSKISTDLLIDTVDDPLLFPPIDFARLEAIENGTLPPGSFEYPDSVEDASLSHESPSQGIDDENKLGNGDEMEFEPVEEVKKTKRVLEFDDDDLTEEVVNEGAIGEDMVGGFELEKNEEERVGEDDFLDLLKERDEKKKKKKKKTRVKSDSGDESKANLRPSNKRTEEKERKAYLNELHAESQRLLRETRDASFKPIQVVQKPISSVLEKIRKRKLEISKKAMVVNSYGFDGSRSSKDRQKDLDVSYEDIDDENMEIIVEKAVIPPSLDEGISLTASKVDECKDAAKLTAHESDQHQVPPIVEPTPPLRAPVHDTEDLFDDSEPISTTVKQNDKLVNSPLEDDFAPSSLAMNLKFDSAPVDDSSSDEDYNDKENVEPHPCGIVDGSSSPKADFAKDFIDDEADEEDDSDNDLMRFPENEEAEDLEDLKELNDMIATGYEEKPIDNDKRNELHQKWLEQQDAAGTENLMQKLKCGSDLKDAMLQDKESETDEDDGEFDDEAKEDSLPRNSARLNIKKAKQIILQLLPDKEDAYLSDDDDDTQSRLARRRLISKEEQSTIVSPADDESSREVFGLIKKLNIVSENKRKPKALSFFDSVLKGGNSNNSSKSSFLGRVSNHSLPSSRKQGSGAVRSFIFEREDSNSRSAMSISESSSDTVTQETQPTRHLTAKYSNSQAKHTSQSSDGAFKTSSKSSLLEILKRSSSSLSHQVCNQDTTIDLTKGIFAFRAPKKPTKIEGRS
ncbi:hypothetical protein CASFOL_017116 [Castilleja foliolosa]|uniref:DNA replication checkpoint mediator MRC1 domain-containing protein n=1 Tax=Castilleja foliolosa TaxID=1961234 RepID=A0ABD3DBI0_9LAMI